MKLARSVFASATLALLAACATEPPGPPPVVHEAGSTGMTVAGRDGWQFDRVVRFGDFATSQVGLIKAHSNLPSTLCLGGCNGSTSIAIGPFRKEFEQRYTSASSRFEFMQKAPDGLEAVVRAIHQVDHQTSEQATLWFGIPTSVAVDNRVTTSLMGTIEAVGDDRPAWRFVLLGDSEQRDAAKPAGWLVDDTGRRILLTHMPLPANIPAIVQRMAHGMGGGYRFELDGHEIGSVALMPPARVWMRDETAPELKLAMASFSSAMLLMPRDPN